jgi:NAD(P)-dependent dehydrogenase (short-subunit alcohol dehydrogenase family)
MYSEQDVPDQSGKTVFITGANTGIGFETARVLAASHARVLMGCRSEIKAREAMARIHSRHPAADIHWVPLELASLKSVQQAAEQVSGEARLDMLINNAGVMMPPRTLTEDRFELQFGVNHLGHFALTAQLLDLLKMTGGARIVNVSSLAHRRGQIDFEDVNAENGYRPQERYQMSKVANMYFTMELARRLKQSKSDILSVACHPGIADTELSRYFPAWFKLIGPVLRPLFNSPLEGALPTLLAATGPNIQPMDYYGPVKRGETARSAGKAVVADQVWDEDIAKRLWSLSEQMTGLTFDL